MIKKLSASLLATLFLVGAFGTLSGCNTMEGAGKDIQAGGSDQGRGSRAQEILAVTLMPCGRAARRIAAAVVVH